MKVGGRLGQRRGRLARRVGQLIVAMGIVVGGVTTVGQAAASPIGEQTCSYQAGRYNVCFQITPLFGNLYAVHIGIDITMSQATAQTILDQPGDPFGTWLFGADGSPADEDVLGQVPATYESAWSGGLSAEFEIWVDRSFLDEDSGEDDVFGRVKLYIASVNRTFAYQTNEVNGYF